MKAQILITLEDDGRLNVAASPNNPLLCLGLLEVAKDVIKGETAQQQSRIEIPKMVIQK